MQEISGTVVTKIKNVALSLSWLELVRTILLPTDRKTDGKGITEIFIDKNIKNIQNNLEVSAPSVYICHGGDGVVGGGGGTDSRVATDD